MLKELYDKSMKKMLGKRRKEILQFLSKQKEQVKMVQLSKKFDISMPLVTFHVNMLIGNGLVERKHNIAGLVTGIKITVKGNKLINELI